MSTELERCLRARRSVRKFTSEPVDRAELQELLELAVLAPSASNLQPWRFIVADDPALVGKIRSFSPGISGEPPCLILFCLDTALLPVRADGSTEDACAVLDLAMAAENLMLAAAGRGLGSCAVKSFHPKLVRRILDLPERFCLELLVTLGHPARIPEMPRRRPLEELIHYNAWEEGVHGTGL